MTPDLIFADDNGLRGAHIIPMVGERFSFNKDAFDFGMLLPNRGFEAVDRLSEIDCGKIPTEYNAGV